MVGRAQQQGHTPQELTSLICTLNTQYGCFLTLFWLMITFEIFQYRFLKIIYKFKLVLVIVRIRLFQAHGPYLTPAICTSLIFHIEDNLLHPNSFTSQNSC